VVALQSAIQGLNEEVQMLQSDLRGGVYIDPTAPPAEVVNELEQHIDRLDYLRVR
jgi:hypothetical protein